MNRWLARLKNEKYGDVNATKPTKPELDCPGDGFVGSVACIPVTIKKIEGATSHAEAVNDALAVGIDPDRDCWPHSSAMNGREIDVFMARLTRFTDRGLSYDDAESVADKLVFRDRDCDDRRCCLECTHLRKAALWRCSNCQRAGVAREGIPFELVMSLQHCPGFQHPIYSSGTKHEEI